MGATNRTPRTIAASNGVGADAAFGSVVPPIHLSSTFTFAGFGKAREHDYTRAGNPTRDLLADTLAKLEDGAGAVVVSSGMAALNLALYALVPGDLIVAPHDCYAGTWRLLTARMAKRHFETVFVDQNDDQALAQALARRPKLVLVETPSNPLMRVVDVRKIAASARAVGARTIVDNTFLSPAAQRPVLLGADIVVHSTTKFLSGHSDVVGGAVIAAHADDVTAMKDWATTIGVTGSPFDSYMTLRGIRTLFARMDRQQASAASIAAFLATDKAVRAVHYPGLPGHPTHAIAKTQQQGFGAMISFEVANGLEGARRLVESLRVITLAESLGGVESLIAHPVTMTHASMSPEARLTAGITDGLLRLSVGLEAETDLIGDLDQALRSV